MNRIVMALCVFSWLSVGAGTAWSQEAKPAPITVLKDSAPVTYGRSAKIKAVVGAIDLTARSITLKGPKGRPLTMRVEDRVRNLPDIAVGDEVVVRYHESVGIELRLAGEGESIAQDESDNGKGGQMPGASVRRTEIANVESTSLRGKSVVLKTPDGRFLDLYVRDEAVLNTFHPGDSVVATYTQATVVSVEGPKDKDAKDTKGKKKPNRK